MKYLLSISIGPVQDFIATARRSRDLWFGSWLLSELSKAAALAICGNKPENLSRLIFPWIKTLQELQPGSPFNVVNKLLAQVDNPKETGAEIKSAIDKRLSEITTKCFIEIQTNDSFGYFARDLADKQVNDLVELFWSAYPLDTDAEYSNSREQVEYLLGARKATRDFGSAEAWASNAPKSALDGQRESVIHDDAFGKLSVSQLRQTYGVGEGERLCGVGLFKRNSNRGGEGSFFSTSHVAALPLLKRLEAEHESVLQTYINELCSALDLNKESSDLGRVPYREPYKPHNVFSRTVNGERIGYDGHLLFANRLEDLKENDSDGDKLNKAQTALNRFLDAAFDGETPLPYYSLLLADGDNMGKSIDNIGHMQIENTQNDIDKHRRLSEDLSAFARSASDIVIGKHSGSLVYAGGDDVLAFLPVHTVLQCARELSDAFKEKLKEFSFEEKGKTYRPSLSVGIVIAHHMESLQDALTLVRAAEKAAKKVKGKNAFAVTLSKRSGADTTIKGSIATDATSNAFDYRLLRFAQLHLGGDLPDGAAFELRDLHLHLNCEKEAHEYESLQGAMRDEAVRILARKKIKDPMVRSELSDDIKNGRTSIEDLANELIVAREFARAFKQAGIKMQDLEIDIAKAEGKEAEA